MLRVSGGVIIGVDVPSGAGQHAWLLMAWSLNLAAEPAARAFVDRRWVAVEAEETQGGDRERLWQALSQGNPWLARAAARAGRDLPVIVLRPLGGKAAL
jgi:hypothetical protein